MISVQKSSIFIMSCHFFAHRTEQSEMVLNLRLISMDVGRSENLEVRVVTWESKICLILKLDFYFQNLEFKTHQSLQIQGLMYKNFQQITEHHENGFFAQIKSNFKPGCYIENMHFYSVIISLLFKNFDWLFKRKFLQPINF